MRVLLPIFLADNLIQIEDKAGFYFSCLIIFIIPSFIQNTINKMAYDTIKLPDWIVCLFSFTSLLIEIVIHLHRRSNWRRTDKSAFV